jgi:hypothetical protein
MHFNASREDNVSLTWVGLYNPASLINTNKLYFGYQLIADQTAYAYFTSLVKIGSDPSGFLPNVLITDKD